MRRQAIVLWCALVGLLAGCSGVNDSAAPAAAESPAVPFELSTHCGLHELRTDDGHFFERVGGPLTDGSGNPPHGWGNPIQSGQLVVTEELAVFTDDLSHREEFRLREGATDFLQICS
ncbi:hypothetical protein [Cellulomonas xylanilytica]|uniref:Lipoprotein n=1 Tax=Cellulomonas xylanilytica TaxID=233583 RepID=A0A510V5A2_9CELL|nr:hypothetical protein [Cellulomonas xylanilytica]GEK20490.1 hypothetical protein CXY01_10100 [Cellulomonas xylanilytica]